MLPGIYSAANSMDAAQRQHEIVSRNLAYGEMPGFRRLIPYAPNNPEGGAGGASNGFSGPKNTEEAIDFTPGPMQQTGEPLDFAINGKGLFTIEGPDGPLYTRNGVFQLNHEGTLVTSEGLPVLGEGGPIQFPPNADLRTLQVGRDGQLSIGKNEIGRLQVISVEDEQKFKMVGTTLMSLEEDVEVQPATGDVIHKAHEGSNVHPVHELVTMIATMRQHEAAQRAMNSISKAIEQHTNLTGG
ncbi:MAG: flagellar hook-basal body protein [Planctomycetaceae bacterium]|nr:flagellar hook-basal body protein [Planctomycetaceae bacterium]